MGSDRVLRSRVTAARLQKNLSLARPSKLLNTVGKHFTNRHRYRQNASESPFLRLPQEIRNTIYELVLGGRTIHVYPKGRRVGSGKSDKGYRSSICQAHQSNPSFVDNIPKDEPPREVQSYDSQHTQCTRTMWSTVNTPVTIQLDLLQVCGQIHKEAALIPFIHNTFSFSFGTCGTSRFFNGLVPMQARAVRSLCLEHYSKPGLGVKKLLTGLRHLLLYHECDTASEFYLRKNLAEDEETGRTSYNVYKASDFSNKLLTSKVVALRRVRGVQQGYRYFTNPALSELLTRVFES